MNRQILINRLRAHVPQQNVVGIDCDCGQHFPDCSQADLPSAQWARHVASVIYPETAGADKTIRGAP